MIEADAPTIEPPEPLLVQIGNEDGMVLVELGAPRQFLIIPPDVAMEIAVSLMKHARRAGYAPRSVN